MKNQAIDIQYFVHPQLFEEYYKIIYRRLLVEKKNGRVCELGAGSNPSLSPRIIKERNIEYWVTDVSKTVLAQSTDFYQCQVLDAQTESITESLGQFDLIFSKMLVEHLPNARIFHQNILDALKPSGYAFHFFPTLGSLTLWLNHVLPEFLTKPLLMWGEPSRREERFGKFKSYYQWCEGPTHRNIRRFEELGFEVAFYYGSYGHKYYEKLTPLHWLEQQKSKVLQRIGVPQLTANACMLLRKK